MADAIMEGERYAISRCGYLHFATVTKVFGRGGNRQVQYTLQDNDGKQVRLGSPLRLKIAYFRELMLLGESLLQDGG